MCWVLTLFNDYDTLDYCEYCRSPDGRVGTLELWQRDGADPVELLSAWEREQLERRSLGSEHVTKTAGECLATSDISKYPCAILENNRAVTAKASP